MHLREIQPSSTPVAASKRNALNGQEHVGDAIVQPPLGGMTKRAVDICIACTALILLAPIFLLVAFLVRGSDGGSAFYRHKRLGHNGQYFYCLKFRTMLPNADEVLARHLENRDAAEEWASTRKLKEDPRVTRLGEVLRKSSVDELPQLINVVKGEMSIVGPRPIVDAEVPKYGSAIQHYFRARPGVTGAWQVSGRNSLSYANRVKLDREYVTNWSNRRDFAIILRTVPVVLSARDSY
jgi:exopolysaccharide production protein ExoY